MLHRLSRNLRRASRVFLPRRTSRFVPWAARILHTDEKKIQVWQRLILTSFFATSLVYGLNAVHLLEGVETWWLDKMANADLPRFNAPITVVCITDRDYYAPGLFNGVSPLDPGGLDRILKRVLEDQPRGVLLDVQIHPAPNESPERARARLALYRTLREVGRAGRPPVILVRDLQTEEVERTQNPEMQSAWEDLTKDSRLFWADPSIKRSGGMVRSVPRSYGDEWGEGPRLLTILGAAVEAFGLKPHRSVPFWVRREVDDPTVPWRIRFSGEFRNEGWGLTPHRVSAGALLSAPHVAGARSLLTDRLVLIGGTYRVGRDLQPTVVGDMPGIYVWAEAIASWIRHDALREPLEAVSFALEFLIGVVAGLFLTRFGPALGLLALLLAVGPLTALFSLLTFGDRVLFVNFIPSILCVYLHYQIELHLEIRRLKRRILGLAHEGGTRMQAES